MAYYLRNVPRYYREVSNLYSDTQAKVSKVADEWWDWLNPPPIRQSPYGRKYMHMPWRRGLRFRNQTFEENELKQKMIATRGLMQDLEAKGERVPQEMRNDLKFYETHYNRMQDPRQIAHDELGEEAKTPRSDLYYEKHDRNLYDAGFREDDPNTFYAWKHYWKSQGVDEWKNYRVKEQIPGLPSGQEIFGWNVGQEQPYIRHDTLLPPDKRPSGIQDVSPPPPPPKPPEIGIQTEYDPYYDRTKFIQERGMQTDPKPKLLNRRSQTDLEIKLVQPKATQTEKNIKTRATQTEANSIFNDFGMDYRKREMLYTGLIGAGAGLLVANLIDSDDED